MSMARRGLLLLGLLSALIVGLSGVENGARAAPPASRGGASFGSDGYADLAIGVALEDVGAISNAGAANVLYGGAGGAQAEGDQFWHQDSDGVEGGAEAGDFFGSSVAAGDFNGDGYPDLAIGVASEDVEASAGAGAANVLYGTAAGLSAASDQIWHQDSAGVEDEAEAGDLFGNSVAAGDFNGDGYADLAIGALYEDVGALANAGAVNVLYGTAAGLSAAGDQFWHQDSDDVAGVAEAGDLFGFSVAAGDFNGDGYADLAIGARLEDVGASAAAGAVNVLYGTAAGLSAASDQIWHQDSAGMEDEAEAGDNFGYSVAAGDFNGDGYADLAIGAPYEDVEAILDAGAVNVLYGTAAGLSAAGDQIWHQDSAGVEGDGAEASDRFGSGLAVLPPRFGLYLPVVRSP
ncbi:MAG: FG-GAP repeat protein [Candidatus Promineifilaceae bacterium]